MLRNKRLAVLSVPARDRGFTLLELLVAMAIFALVSVMAYGALNTVLDTRTQTDRAAARLNELLIAMRFLSADVEQTVAREIRDEFGDRQPPVIGNSDGVPGIELTRAGYSNPLQRQRSNLQRVGYRLEDGRLVRLTWPSLDRAPDAAPERLELVSGVSGMEYRFMDEKREWHDSWPLLSPTGAGPVTAMPLAVEVRLELEDWGPIVRLLRVPGGP